MRYDIIQGGQRVEIVEAVTIDGAMWPLPSIQLLDDEERQSLGILPHLLTLEEARAAKRAEIVAAYDAVIAAGYPWTAPGGASEALQVRENDLSNWLGLKDSCNEAIAAGKGADPCPLPIRCTSNASYNLTFSETAAVMRDLRTWLSQALAVLWAKKDACRDATTQAELDAINPATGWPA